MALGKDAAQVPEAVEEGDREKRGSFSNVDEFAEDLIDFRSQAKYHAMSKEDRQRVSRNKRIIAAVVVLASLIFGCIFEHEHRGPSRQDLVERINDHIRSNRFLLAGIEEMSGKCNNKACVDCVAFQRQESIRSFPLPSFR